MPFKSKAQNAWAHTPAGTEALGGSAKVKEWESATDYKHLPQKLAEGGTVYTKGSEPKDLEAAKGGGVLPRREDWSKQDPQGRGEFGRFLGTENRFSGGAIDRRVQGDPESRRTEENWEKPKGVGHTDAMTTAITKSEKAVKPRGGGKRHGSVDGG